MPLLRRICVLGLALPFIGCPIGSSVPLALPSRSVVDARLTGQWRCIGPNDDPPGTLDIRATNGGRYSIALSPCRDDENCAFQAHVTKLGRVPILNVAGAEDTSRPWSFVRYALHGPNVLHLKVLQGENVNTVAEAKDAVRAALKRADNDDDLLVCVRRTPLIAKDE